MRDTLGFTIPEDFVIARTMVVGTDRVQIENEAGEVFFVTKAQEKEVLTRSTAQEGPEHG